MLINFLLIGCITIHSVAGIIRTRVDAHKKDPNRWPGGYANCFNSKDSRQCWSPGYDINTDSDRKWPNTGKIVHYDLNITADTLAPDGTPRNMMVINGQYPGPVLTADWGDIFQIDVTNNLVVNGTSMHWHGFNQVNSCTEDGVPGITECPIPPGATRRYQFQATQFGTTWYHSHLTTQYGEGIVGTMVINGPSSMNYDEDLGTLPVTDFYYKSMFELSLLAATNGPPVADNGLVNGRNMNVNKTGGSYHNITLTAGKKYKLRLINTSVDNHFRMSLDRHSFHVIQADFVPIVPYETDWIFLAIGQRYDVIFEATEDPGNYWFRAEVQSGCGLNQNALGIHAIFNYKGVQLGTPTSTPEANYTMNCDEEPDLEPYLRKDVPEDSFSFTSSDTLAVGLTQNDQKVFFWTINGESLNVDWNQPTLNYVHDQNTTYRGLPNLGIHELPDANKWVYWVIQNGGAVPHPIHLHGHSLYHLGASDSETSSNSNSSKIFSKDNIDDLNFKNPTRRDVTMLPASGWVVIAFITNNPGAWLMHCHIAWHISEGLGVQFLERAGEIDKAMNLMKTEENCVAWRTWFAPRMGLKTDSGL